MTASYELREIRKLLQVISQKLDLIIEERDVVALMRLSGESLRGFLEDEPDVYIGEDLKVRYS